MQTKYLITFTIRRFNGYVGTSDITIEAENLENAQNDAYNSVVLELHRQAELIVPGVKWNEGMSSLTINSVKEVSNG